MSIVVFEGEVVETRYFIALRGMCYAREIDHIREVCGIRTVEFAGFLGGIHRRAELAVGGIRLR